jgi:hypothetical protein
MREGCLEAEYVILFEESESAARADGYGVAVALPGFKLIGLRGWDDFLVQDENGNIFSVPSVPLDKNHLAPYQMPPGRVNLERDDRYAGKIKWYVKPLICGGDPKIGDNLVWVSHEEHAQLVRWWNEQYRALKGAS